MAEERGLSALTERVLGRDLCTLCGACASLCPYLKGWRGRIAKLDECDLPEGRCFAYCPRTELDLDALNRAVFGRDYQDRVLGPTASIVAARAAEKAIRDRAQTGGVVSALVAFALESGLIGRAVLTRRGDDLLPRGAVAQTRKEVLACAGSSYVSGPTLETFNLLDGDGAVGLVGLPCQVQALAKMRASPLEKKTPIEAVGLVIGLFCTWAFDWRPLAEFLTEKTGGRPIVGLDITPPPDRRLVVRTEDGSFDLPLDEVRPFIRPGCAVCLDMTAELADLSVGTLEGRPGWNTLIVRSETGRKLTEAALAAGVIETEELARDKLDHLKFASMLKKKRAVEALKARGQAEGGYLKPPPGMLAEIEAAAGEER